MKICYINPTFLIRRPIADLTKHMSEKNDVTVIIPKKIFKKFEGKWHSDEALKKAKIWKYNALSIPGNFEWPIPFSFRFFSYLYRAFKNNDVVHIWAYFYLHTWFVKFFSLFFKTKLIMSCDTFPGYSFSSGKVMDLMFKIYTKLFGWFLFNETIHLYGKSMVPYAKKAGVRKYEVISTGIDVVKFENAKKIELNYAKPIIFYAGLLVPRKGIDIIIELAKKTKATYLLAGDGIKRKEYEKKSPKNVIFLGWRKDIPSLLKSCDAVILPSKGEGMPGIVMEGMAAGKPIIASDITGNRDLVSNNGFLCKNMKDYVYAVSNINDEMGKKSKELIKNFEWHKILSKYEIMYK